MERLTERDEYGNADIIALSDMMPELYAELSFSETNALTDALNRLADYEDTGLMPEEIAAKCKWADKTCETLSEVFGGTGVFDLSHIKELLAAEAEGRLIVLPCKVGDSIYRVVERRPKITMPSFRFIQKYSVTEHNIIHIVKDFGKTVFLTREEAEQALKERAEHGT